MEPFRNTTSIHFVRHGIVYNPTEVFYGRLPGFGLSEEGYAQARALAPFFSGKPIRVIFSSPLLRARQTAKAIAEILDHLPLKTSENLNESQTPYDGKPLSDLTARNWDIYRGNVSPNEQPIDVFNRAYKFIQKAIKDFQGQEIVAVTHADVIVFLILWAHRFEVNFHNKSLIEHKKIPLTFPAPASVTTLTWETLAELPHCQYFTGYQR